MTGEELAKLGVEHLGDRVVLRTLGKNMQSKFMVNFIELQVCMHNIFLNYRRSQGQ